MFWCPILIYIHLFTYAAITTVTIDRQSLNTTVPIGTRNKLLQCNITLSSSTGADHSVLNVTWLHNNQPISASDGVVSTSAATMANMFLTKLTLLHITQSSGGEYCCIASIHGHTSVTSDCVTLHTITGMVTSNIL